jgi:hypothetical protein
VRVLGFYGGLRLDGSHGSASPGLSERALAFGAEAGYGFVIDSVTLRPMLGIGAFSLDDVSVYYEPSVTALVAVSPRFFVGADAAMMFLPPRGNAPVPGGRGPLPGRHR